ncbi:hypothetical protein AMATHDRAFT_5750 [Amanita thiersii Skay4041]|uniref:HMG box domain-containing protein n=1 Tax=Amanita thiersii Skay4041 TaxID=703135 RepID=A0A2A9NL76_9AGAR|nr:hypothetical protein AMATHDRAFT_5750 [Amanita thiersii Skay4041]
MPPTDSQLPWNWLPLANAPIPAPDAPDRKYPKRPPNAFMIYRSCRQKDYTVMGMPQKDISKLIGEEWGTMPDHQKQIYLTMAKKAQAEYDLEYPVHCRMGTGRKRRSKATFLKKSSPYPDSSQRIAKASSELPDIPQPGHHIDTSQSVPSVFHFNIPVPGFVPGPDPPQPIQSSAFPTRSPTNEVGDFETQAEAPSFFYQETLDFQLSQEEMYELWKALVS